MCTRSGMSVLLAHVVASCVSRVTTSRRIPVRTTRYRLASSMWRGWCTRFRLSRSVDHPASLKLKLIANRIPTTLDHARSRHLSPIVGGGMGDGSSRHRFQQQPARPGELLWGAVVGASGPGASPCPCVGGAVVGASGPGASPCPCLVSAHAHDGALRGALSW